jgi:hypothetical protein
MLLSAVVRQHRRQQLFGPSWFDPDAVESGGGFMTGNIGGDIEKPGFRWYIILFTTKENRV